MTSRQRPIVIAGLCAVALSLLFVPFDYVADIGGQTPLLSERTMSRPIWTNVTSSYIKATEFSGAPEVTVQSVSLSAGRLGLMWGAIAILTVAATALAAPRKALAAPTAAAATGGWRAATPR